jgi:Hemingway/CFA97
MWNQMSSSKKIKDIDIAREHIIHKNRLSRVSSRIDNNEPRTMSHIKKNLKGKMIEKTRKDSINISNQILVKKLLKVNTRSSSIKNSQKFLSGTRAKKKDEFDKISNENFRILNKIKTSKPYYSTERLRKQYRYSSNLKNMICQNSGRVPKTLNYTQYEFNVPTPTAYKSSRSLNNHGKIEFPL